MTPVLHNRLRAAAGEGGRGSGAGGARGPGAPGSPGPVRAAAGLLGPRRLAELTAGLVVVPPELVVNDVTLDSRAASPQSLFLACSGRTSHGLKFAQQAVALGASAVLYEDTADTGQAKPDFRVRHFCSRRSTAEPTRRHNRRSFLRCTVCRRHGSRHHRDKWQNHLCLVTCPGPTALQPSGCLHGNAGIRRAAIDNGH
jgi:hypothetical protein